jgi:hypothetical protein
MTGVLRSAESPLHGADDFRIFLKKSAPIMTGETAFPLRCYDSYPLTSCSRASTASHKITKYCAEKVRSFFIVTERRNNKKMQNRTLILLSSNAKKSSLRLPVQPIKATTDYIQNTI